jgi:transmembrane sensor
MPSFLQSLKTLFQPDRAREHEDKLVDDLLQRSVAPVRSTNPDTQQQWLRLQRSLQTREVMPARSRIVPRLVFATAFVALAVFGASLYFLSPQRSTEIFLTGRGEQKQIVLADGSEVVLHHTTELTVTEVLSGKPRHVTLNGEAYFHVKRNDSPFVITTQYGIVEVMGTEFNVRVREKMLEVAVLSGRVSVSAGGDGKDSTIVLTQHQMANVQQNDVPRFIGTIPSPEYPGWRHGKLLLNKTSLAGACREIELRFDVVITIKDGRLGSSIVSGILNAKTAHAAVAALCELTSARFAYDGEKFEIY